MRSSSGSQRHGDSPLLKVPFPPRDIRSRDPDGSIVFKLRTSRSTSTRAKVAADVSSSQEDIPPEAGVPARLKRLEETQVPSWLWRSSAVERALRGATENDRYSSKTNDRQVFDRLSRERRPAGAGRAAGSPPRTMPAPSSTSTATCWRSSAARPTRPHRQRRGDWAYGIDGPGQGRCSWTAWTGELSAIGESAYELPQPHACFVRVDGGRPRQRERRGVSSLGSAERASSSTALEPDRTFPGCARRTRSCRVAASRRA